MPRRLNTLSTRRNVPPYRSSLSTTWSPDESRWSTASVAARPLAKASACFPFSSAARQPCSASRVGLRVREYSNPLCSPGPDCAYVEVRYTGVITAPVVGSGCWPAWMALVSKRSVSRVLIGRLHNTLAEKGDKVTGSTPDPEWSPGPLLQAGPFAILGGAAL